VKLSYYVYYKVPGENAERARAAVAEIQRELRRSTGISGRLLRRRDDAATWMEIYEDIADPAQFEAALFALVKRHGLAQLLLPGTTRRQEVFRPL
jgi:hypothetical protein